MTQSISALPADLMGPSDDSASDADIDSAFDEILGGSEILDQAGVSTPEELDDDGDDADTDDDLGADESGDEEDEDGGDDADDQGDEADDDDESTEGDDEEEEGDDDDADDIDYSFEVPVKIDGEDGKVELSELVKGYQTSQHLSRKGRELADERKAFEAERAEELNNVKETAKVLAAQNAATENTLAKSYSELQEELKAAKSDGDKYRVDELKDEMEEVQAEYWKARKTREKIQEAVKTQETKAEEEAFQKRVEQFNSEINDYVPDFNEEKASTLREFAISKGIPEEVLSTLADARIIGALNEFMELSEKVQKGSAKRKAAPKRTPTTTKKAKPASVKRKEARVQSSKRIQSGNADDGDLDNALDSLVGKYFS